MIALLCYASVSPLFVSLLVGAFAMMLVGHFLGAMPTWCPEAGPVDTDTAKDLEWAEQAIRAATKAYRAQVALYQHMTGEADRSTLPSGHAPTSPLPSLPSVLAFIRTVDQDPSARMYTVDVGDGLPYRTIARDSLDAIDRVIQDLRDLGESAPRPSMCTAAVQS